VGAGQVRLVSTRALLFLWSRLRTSFVNQRKYFHQCREDVLRQAREYCNDGEIESRRRLPAIFAVSATDVTQLAAR